MSPTNVHGIEAKVYIGSDELTEANAWSLACAADMAELVKHGSIFKERLKGAIDWSGSITVFHDQDGKIVQQAAFARISYSVILYPDGSEVDTYYQGTAFFDFEHASDVGSAQAITVPFFGSGTLVATGFAA